MRSMGRRDDRRGLANVSRKTSLYIALMSFKRDGRADRERADSHDLLAEIANVASGNERDRTAMWASTQSVKVAILPAPLTKETHLDTKMRIRARASLKPSPHCDVVL